MRYDKINDFTPLFWKSIKQIEEFSKDYIYAHYTYLYVCELIGVLQIVMPRKTNIVPGNEDGENLQIIMICC